MAKEDDDYDMIGGPSGDNLKVASEELRDLIERFEALEEDKASVMKEQKDILAEAKSRGYNTKVMRKIIAERKRDPEEVSEEEAILFLYRSALGMSAD